MVFIITFSIATILFHCVDLSHPIKSFPAWSSKLFLLWNIFLYFDTAFLFFFFFLIVEWYFIVFIYHLLWTCVPFVVTILAVCADRVAVKLVTETHAGTRRGSICHSKAKQWGRLGTRIWAVQSQSSLISPAGYLPLLLFVHHSCTPTLLSRDVLKCLSASYCCYF